jgi:hypothetical protein
MSDRELTPPQAARLAALALDCIRREYPNKLSHVLSGDGDVQPPRRLTPAFYGCYDWHSAVHNHWLLARVARLFPAQSFARAARKALEVSLTAANIQGEVAYLTGEGRESFERPYGLAWLLQLVEELSEWDQPVSRRCVEHLRPLERIAVDRLENWLSKLESPVRTGEHNQTAFSLCLLSDYGRQRKNLKFMDLLTARARKFYLKDTHWALDYEPSGEDFLSPSLAEADLMRRALSAREFAGWFSRFFPAGLEKFQPVVSPDPGDPKFSHLDGLNLSRAWMLAGIRSALPDKKARAMRLQELADLHAEAGLAALTGKHYVGSHWLGTFAVYLLTHRGIT